MFQLAQKNGKLAYLQVRLGLAQQLSLARIMVCILQKKNEDDLLYLQLSNNTTTCTM
jgi:hypothetical protein